MNTAANFSTIKRGPLPTYWVEPKQKSLERRLANTADEVRRLLVKGSK